MFEDDGWTAEQTDCRWSLTFLSTTSMHLHSQSRWDIASREATASVTVKADSTYLLCPAHIKPKPHHLHGQHIGGWLLLFDDFSARLSLCVMLASMVT